MAAKRSNYSIRISGERPTFASERLGSSHTAVSSDLKSVRDDAAKEYVASRKTDEPTVPSVQFNRFFSLNRDYRLRYASPYWLRRRGLIGGRRAVAHSRFIEELLGLNGEGGEGA
jgi:hypothetical protein